MDSVTFKKLLMKNKYLYEKLIFIKKVGFGLVLVNFVFNKILRINNIKCNFNFTSKVVGSDKISFHDDVSTLVSFAVSGHCYFQGLNGIILGKNLLFAPGVKIISSNHGLNDRGEIIKTKAIIIGDNVWIGANVSILPSVEIGNNCIIGAGSVVTKSFPESNIIIAGNPAIIIRRY